MHTQYAVDKNGGNCLDSEWTRACQCKPWYDRTAQFDCDLTHVIHNRVDICSAIVSVIHNRVNSCSVIVPLPAAFGSRAL